MKNFLSTVFILTLFTTQLFGQIKNETDVAQRINNYLLQLEKVGFSGSVIVKVNGKKIISAGYGYCNKEKQIKNTPTTLFDIGSITKQFTAAAILKLEMQGKLSTDDTITKYFKNVPADKSSITIHDLLRHHSGLQGVVGKDYDKISQEEFLDTVMNSKLRFKAGAKFAYSNIGYSLLAMIIEKVSGKTYETYLYENLWKPADMENTGYTRPQLDTNKIAVGYYKDGKVWGRPIDKEWDNNAPYWHLKGNGGILSTTEDLYKWHNALMSDKILSKEAKHKLYHPKIKEEESETSYYAYGWDVSKTKRNTTQAWHNGSNHIFYADFIRFIDEDVAIIMLSNKSHPNFNDLNREIAKIIFYEKYTPEIPIEDNESNHLFTDQIIKTIEDSGLEKAKELYQQKNESVKLIEYLMRDEGFQYIDNNKADIAIQLFEMNVFVYPNSAKALQGLGEGYMETGKKELALKYFKQCLSMDPDNPFVENMIKEIEE